MALIFYPNSDDLLRGTLLEKIDILMEGAQNYKAVILDETNKQEVDPNKLSTPRDLTAAYNWEEIATVLRLIKELPETSADEKIRKSDHLKKLAEVYEVLRAAKMSKLEAVRLAIINEANQLRGGQVA